MAIIIYNKNKKKILFLPVVKYNKKQSNMFLFMVKISIICVVRGGIHHKYRGTTIIIPGNIIITVCPYSGNATYNITRTVLRLSRVLVTYADQPLLLHIKKPYHDQFVRM